MVVLQRQKRKLNNKLKELTARAKFEGDFMRSNLNLLYIYVAQAGQY
jgi:hypothetical protein